MTTPPWMPRYARFGRTSDFFALISKTSALRSLLGAPFVFVGAAIYFTADISAREVSQLESQDLGIASELFKSYSISPDHSPLHFVFLNFWQRLDATSVAFLRAPSVVFCALAAAIVFSLARRIAGHLAGFLSAAFLATNPEVVDNARSMRMYALVVLLAASCFWFAHRYLVESRRRRHLIGFAISAVVAIYNHLFMWLLIGSLCLLFIADQYRARSFERDQKFLRRSLVIVAALLIPQFVHIFIAIGYTHERHALYRGIASGAANFLVPIARTLFLGDFEWLVPIDNYLFIAPIVLMLLGMKALKRTRVVATIFAPALAVAWVLSLSNPVEPRYLNFLAPVMAILMGVGAAQPSMFQWRALLSVAVFAIALFATHVAYSVPPTDWYGAAARLEAVRKPDDVVAVFPDYWDATFRRYSGALDTTPIAFPVDLERVMARAKRVLLVRYPGRDFANIEAWLKINADEQELFRTKIRDALVIDSVVRKDPTSVEPTGRPPPIEPSAEPTDSVLLAGVVGSGGYPWQGHSRGANPFARLEKTFAGSRIVVTGYAPYHPPWLARLLLGAETARSLEPNVEVPSFLAQIGVNAAALVCKGRRACGAGSDALDASGIAIVPRLTSATPVLARLYDVGGVSVGVFELSYKALYQDEAFAEASLDATVNLARSQVGARGRLIAFVPAVADYGRLPTTNERCAARRLVELGVDVVAGVGGYAAKEVEEYKGGVIAYSLGTLLRPPMLSLASHDSTGIALRVSFPIGARAHYQIIPLMFDDQSEAALGSPSSATGLVLPNEEDASRRLVNILEQADAGYESSDGVSHSFGVWRAEQLSSPSELEQWFFAHTAALTEWFPLAPQNTPLRPFDGVDGAQGTYVGRRGVSSLGEFRRVIELESGGRPAVWVHFHQVRLSARLDIAFGLPDDRLRSKFKALREQRIIVTIGDREVLSEAVPYRVGWHRVAIDTAPFAGAEHDVKIVVRVDGTHFPVAIDARVSRGD